MTLDDCRALTQGRLALHGVRDIIKQVPPVRFVDWFPKQQLVINTTARKVALPGGLGGGKTDCALELFHKRLEEESHEAAILCGFTTRTIRRRLNQYRKKKGLVQVTGTEYRHAGVDVFLVGGEKKDQSDRIGSLNISLIFIDEAQRILHSVFDELRQRLREGDPSMIVSYNPPAPGHWIYTDTSRARRFEQFHFETGDNPHLKPSPEEYIFNLGYLPGSALYTRFVLGLPVQVNELVPIECFEERDFVPQYAFLDPAYGSLAKGSDSLEEEEYKHNSTALCILGWDDENRPTCFVASWRAGIMDCMPDVAMTLAEAGLDFVYYETIGSFAGLAAPFLEFGITALPHRQSKNKEARILENLTPFLRTLRITCSEEVRYKIMSFSPDEKNQDDDEIDAISSAIELMDRYEKDQLAGLV